LDEFLGRFRPAFNAAQFGHFRRYVAGLALAAGRRTVTGITRLFLDAPDQSVLNRFLADSRWTRGRVAHLRRCLARDLAATQDADEQFLVIDDTVLERRDSRSVEGVGVHYGGKGKNCRIRGHCIVTSLLVTGELSLPLDLGLYDKARASRDPRHNKLSLARTMVQRMRAPKGRRTVLLADSWYFSRDLVDAVSRRGWDWVFALRANRLVWTGSSSLKVGKLAGLRARGPYDGGRPQADGMACVLPGIGAAQIVFWRLPGRGPRARCLVTNRLDWHPADVVARYTRRSRIEMFYWSSKQYLGLGEYRVRKAEAAMRHWELAFCAYVVLTALDLGQPEDRRLGGIGRICHRLAEQGFVDSLRRAYVQGRAGKAWSLAACAEEPATYHLAANPGA